MIGENSEAKAGIELFDRLGAERKNYESAWQDIRDLVRPHASDFVKFSVGGDVRSNNIYDGTAVQASDELAAAITAHTTSATDRWFSFEIDGDEELNRDTENIFWMERVADIIYAQFRNPRSKFNATLYEANSDLSSFGTSIVGQEWNSEDGHLLFRAHPLSDCYIDENSKGQIDTVARLVNYSSRQIQQHFPDAAIPAEISGDIKNSKRWDVIHLVRPRGERAAGRYDSGNKEFSSCWILKDKAVVLKEGGYDSLPYHVARWSVMSGECYGRGPAIKCLPDIRMLNRMEYTMIKAAQRAVMPPMVVPNDGYFGPIKTAPDSINFKEPGAENIETLKYEGNYQIGLESSNQKRDAIRKCFYAEWVKFNQKTERQTAYEISELVDQQLRMMGAVVGRLQDEVLGPLLDRSFSILHDKGMIPMAPQALHGKPFKIVYLSTAARAQVGSKATMMGRFLQELIPLAQIDPSVMDAVDIDRYAQELALLRGVTRRILRSVDEIGSRRNERQQQQQLASVAQNAEPASKAILNLANAQQAGAA